MDQKRDGLLITCADSALMTFLQHLDQNAGPENKFLLSPQPKFAPNEYFLLAKNDRGAAEWVQEQVDKWYAENTEKRGKS